MKGPKWLWMGIGLWSLCLHPYVAGEKSKTCENYPSDFVRYEALRFSGGQEIISPDKVVSADNNWDILLACLGGKTREELQGGGVGFTESQLMLLKAMGFLEFVKGADPERLLTVMPILGVSEKRALIKKAGDLAGEIEPELRDEIEKLKEALARKGYEERLFSVLFSAVVDGIVWFSFMEQGFVNAFALDRDRPLFDGIYWAGYPRRDFRCGTNIAVGDDVFMILNWSDGPMKKIQEAFHWDNLYALRDEFLAHGKVADEKLLSGLMPYGIVDDGGKFICPIIEMEESDAVFSTCRSLAAKIVEFMGRKLDLEKLRREFGFSSKEKAFVVVYHEWMWEFMERLVRRGLVRKPLAFSSPERAEPKDIGKLFFIVKGSFH